METAQAAQQLLRLERSEAADLGRPGARRIDRIQHVDVEADISLSVADDAPRFLHDGLWALLHCLLDADDAHPHFLGIGDVLTIIHRPPNADLHHAPGIEDALLNGAAERRAMGIFEAAEILVIEIGMSVEMDHADGPLFADGAQDGERAQMIAARRQRPYALADQRFEPGLDPLEPILHIGRVDRAVAEIGAIGDIIRSRPEDLVHAPHHRGIVADLARAMARSRPVGGAGIPGYAGQTDIDTVCLVERHMRQAHERGDAAKTRRDETGYRLVEGALGTLHHTTGSCKSVIRRDHGTACQAL